MKVLHDMHTHTLFSPCCNDPEATIEAYVAKAAEMGYRALGISNHLWDVAAGAPNGWYKGQSVSFIMQEKNSIPKDLKGVRLYFGAETEYCGMSDTLGITPDAAQLFDYLQVPYTHTQFRNFTLALPEEFYEIQRDVAERLKRHFPELTEATRKRMAGSLWVDDSYPLFAEKLDFTDYVSKFLTDGFERLLNNLMFQEVSRRVPVIIAHPFKPLEPREVAIEAMRRIDKEKVYTLCKRAAEMNLAFDINLCSYLLPENGYSDDPMVEITRIAKEAGVKFAIGTDTHSLKGMESIERAEAICRAVGITDGDWSPLVL
ncbi:MAG: hypothetical protein IJZ80_10165 [Clostridia bacterium]|nr:hypothetical protein [Clostridia bacterium]